MSQEDIGLKAPCIQSMVWKRKCSQMKGVWMSRRHVCGFTVAAVCLISETTSDKHAGKSVQWPDCWFSKLLMNEAAWLRIALTVWLTTSEMQRTSRVFSHTVDQNVSVHKDPKTIQTVKHHYPSLHTSLSNSAWTRLSTKVENFTAVILLTYMRSGSSFTGDILQQAENSFYVFEPFRMLNYFIKTRTPIHWLNGTLRSTVNMNQSDVLRQNLIGWLTCNFSSIYAQSFDDWFFFSFGRKTTVYNRCIIKNFGVKMPYPKTLSKEYPWVGIPAFRRGLNEKCLLELQDACLASKFRIVKTIRTHMSLASDILHEISNSKVIHLIRDPRATVLSQIRYRGCPGNKSSVSTCAKWHCRRAWNDTIVKNNLDFRLQSRVLTVLFEHIASHPIKWTDLMFKFLGMELTENISSYVRMVAQGDNVTGCVVCGLSWQSRNHSDVSSNTNDTSHIQDICTNVMTHYGYEFYNTSQI